MLYTKDLSKIFQVPITWKTPVNENKQESDIKTCDTLRCINTIFITVTTLATRHIIYFNRQNYRPTKENTTTSTISDYVWSILGLFRKKHHEEVSQQRIDKLSTNYYFVYCDNKAIDIKTTIKWVEWYNFSLFKRTEEEFSNYKGSRKELWFVYHPVTDSHFKATSLFIMCM